MRFTTASRMVKIDRETVDQHQITETALMETAGQLTARHIRRHFLTSDCNTKIVVLCGKGHNGADGMVTARWLAKWGYQLQLVLPASAAELSPLTRQQLVSIQHEQAIKIVHYSPGSTIPDGELYVDALLGTGLKGDPRKPFNELIYQLNNSRMPVVSLDIPSGLSGDSHLPYSPCVVADLTVTFGLPKLGLLLEPGYVNAGKVIVQELGFPESAYRNHAGPCHLITNFDMARFLPIRHPYDHKSSAGRLMVIAGSDCYPGAAFLTANAASVCGAGLVSLIGPNGLADQQTANERDLIFSTTQQELFDTELENPDFLKFLKKQHALIIGPGLNRNEFKQQLLKKLLPKISQPVVIDADGLNNLATEPELFQQLDSAVLTPHPGELARLLSKTVDQVAAEPVRSTRELVRLTGQTVVLKTSRPLIVHPDGNYSINVSGSPALAKAGSGDILSGMIGAFLAAGLKPGPASCLGCYLHGLAGRAAETVQDQLTVRAENVIEQLPTAVRQLRSGETPDKFPLQFESLSWESLQWNPFQK